MICNFPAVTDCTTNFLHTFPVARMEITQKIKNSSEERKEKDLLRKVSIIEGYQIT